MLPQRLRNLEHETQQILLHTFLNFKNTGMLWSMGKDSTALLWMVRKLFNNEVPFPLFHVDTSFKIPEMISFRDKLKKEWNLPLNVYIPEKALKDGMNSTHGKLECCKALKTTPLLKLISENNLNALIVGIRRDEEGSRSKERYFSLRKKDGTWDLANQDIEIQGLFPRTAPPDQHYRVHPLLSWTELDIWQYIRHENIPFSELYLSRKGKRYRSLGCAPCTGAIDSTALTIDEIVDELHLTKISERSGRAQDQETRYALEKLRSQGYM
jgi:sulfate adenylyltransferase subunit 2